MCVCVCVCVRVRCCVLRCLFYLVRFDDELRAITGLGLKEAKAAVETEGSVVKEHLTKEEAAVLEKKLVDVGAKVSIE